MIFLLDSHCDSPLMLVKGADFGQTVQQGYTPGKFPVTHVDFAKMKKGGVNGSFFAIYTSNSLSPDESTRRAFELISGVYDAVEQNPDKVAFATTPAQAKRNKKNGLISIFLGMENGDPIQKDLSMLRMFYRLGVRYLTLTHAGNNEICDSCAPKEKRWGGVSPFGKEVIEECNRLGMLIDVSHISDDSFWDVLKYSKAPVVATHSCCRALASHSRNMSDEMIVALADKGGVIQINFYPAFLDNEYAASEIWDLEDIFELADKAWQKDKSNVELQQQLEKSVIDMNAIKKPSYKRVVDHIDHVVSLVGVKHVGLGSDFDGINTTPKGLEDISKIQRIIIELRRRGYKEHEIKAIAGGNFFRVMDAVQRFADEE
ncbi:MAG: dipeptidase [Bacteroidales bacterium]|jgi:membrane dipeptidase|nr:dipeptidase [Bacteroidales bacterium]